MLYFYKIRDKINKILKGAHDIKISYKKIMKFSIIICAYNAELEIENAIKSVLNQSFNDYEIIVVNDASTDNTKKIVSRYESVKLLNNEKNIKAGGARNRGIENAIGEYILFLDSDDCFTNNNVLSIINQKIIEAKNPDIIYLGFKNTQNKEYLPNENNSQKKNRLLEWKFANIWDVCWNKEFLIKNKIKFVEEKFFEDFPFYYEGIIKSNTYAYVQYPIITYTKNRKNSMTTNLNIQKISDFYNNMTILVNLNNICNESEKELLSQVILREHHNLENYFLKMI